MAWIISFVYLWDMRHVLSLSTVTKDQLEVKSTLWEEVYLNPRAVVVSEKQIIFLSVALTIVILCHSYLCTEQLIYISALKLRESAEISAVRCTNLNGIVNGENNIFWVKISYVYEQTKIRSKIIFSPVTWSKKSVTGFGKVQIILSFFLPVNQRLVIWTYLGMIHFFRM